MAKRYNSKYDALEAVLTGAFDFKEVKTAAQIQEERAAKRQAQADANRKRYVQLGDVLQYSERDRERLRKLEEVVRNPTTAPQEKESARRSIERIKAKGGK